MSTTLPVETHALSGETLEKVLIQGDLSKLSSEERLSYYRRVCESLGLNPLTKPFAYIQLSGKLTLYATRDCADQLRKRDKISIKITERKREGDVYVVTAQASTPDGRTDESTGAVWLGVSKGNDLANSLMRAETKSKRRVTLSISGLGFLDETEVETIPDAEHPTAKQLPNTGDTTRPTDAPSNGKPLPRDGAELVERLKGFEAKLVAEGLCEPGALLAEILSEAQKHNLDAPPDLTEWATKEAFGFAAKVAKNFEQRLRWNRKDVVTPQDAAALRSLMREYGVETAEFCAYYHVTSPEHLPEKHYLDARDWIESHAGQQV